MTCLGCEKLSYEIGRVHDGIVYCSACPSFPKKPELPEKKLSALEHILKYGKPAKK